MSNSSDPDLSSQLIEACRHENQRLVVELLEKKADVNSTCPSGSTPFLHACCKSNNLIVSALIDASADVNATTKNGSTGLMIAASFGHLNVMSTIISKRVNQPLLDLVNGQGNPVMMTAVCYRGSGCIEMVALLISEGFNFIGPNNHGRTPLMEACSRGGRSSAHLASLLLNAGAGQVINATDPGGHTALMMATALRHTDVVALLLSARADVECRNAQGTTALMAACGGWNADPCIASALISAGADPRAQDKAGRTAMDYAIESGNAELCGVLEWGEQLQAIAEAEGGERRSVCALEGAAARDDAVEMKEHAPFVRTKAVKTKKVRTK